MSTELIERAEQILQKDILPDRHSYFQIEKFIIGKEVTTQAQLWQIIRELDARQETVASLQGQIEDAEDQLELFEIDIERLNLQIRKLTEVENDDNWFNKENRKLEIQACEINIRKTERKRVSLGKSARKVAHKMRSILEEMNCLIAAYDKVIGIAGECKPFDDRDSQREMWNEKLLEEFNLRALLNRPLETDFVKTVMALDDDAPVKVHTVELLGNIQNKMLSDHRKQTQSQIAKGTPKNAPKKTKAAPKPPKQKPQPRQGGVYTPQRRPVRGKSSIIKK